MNYFKKLYVPVGGAILSAIVFQLANSSKIGGVFLDSLFPCVQNPGTSFPCYVPVDFGVMVVASIFFFISVILALVRILKISS